MYSPQFELRSSM